MLRKGVPGSACKLLPCLLPFWIPLPHPQLLLKMPTCSLAEQLEAGKVCYGRFDGERPTLAAVTTGGRILLHCPHASDSADSGTTFLQVKKDIQAIAAGARQSRQSSINAHLSSVLARQIRQRANCPAACHMHPKRLRVDSCASPTRDASPPPRAPIARVPAIPKTARRLVCCSPPEMPSHHRCHAPPQPPKYSAPRSSAPYSAPL